MGEPTWLQGQRLPAPPVIADRLNQTSFLNVPVGPGWVVLSSPNCAILWRLDGTQDREVFSEHLVTGPASSVPAWVGKMGTQLVVENVLFALDTTAAARQSDGFILTGLAPPVFPAVRRRMAARFYEGGVYRKGSGQAYAPQVGPVLASRSMPISVFLGPAADVPVAFPPGNREQFHGHSFEPLIYKLFTGDPGGAPGALWESAPVTAISIDVPPTHFVGVENPNVGATTMTGNWRDLGSVRQT